MKVQYLIFILIVFTQNIFSQSTDAIIFTANQDFLSRIYILKMDGTVHNYFQYDFYRFADMEVVNNELYACDAFAPRMYRVDPATGDLDLIIDDWSLFYFYDLAFDGIYFYVDEWDLNRYDINGVYNGTASFNETVYGSAWDGQYYWTLGDENIIKCWDISGWPIMTAVLDSNFIPPTDSCRGLWYDGEYFWSAESGNTVGKIYKFNRNGNIIQQWNEPAFSGWGACVIEDFFEPIPVELVSFTAKVIIGNVELQWQTATETNNAGFEVEKAILNSLEGETWEVLGFVNGNGTTTEPMSYSFVDRNVQTGVYQYRLKQIDTDGRFEYSDVVEVEIIPNEFALYQNYPNPFNPTTKIRYQLQKESKVVIKIYDVLGAEVITLLNEKKEPGVYEVELNAQSLPSGTYIYRIVSGDFVETKKMVLLR
jgi:hypothetical protein